MKQTNFTKMAKVFLSAALMASESIAAATSSDESTVGGIVLPFYGFIRNMYNDTQVIGFSGASHLLSSDLLSPHFVIVPSLSGNENAISFKSTLASNLNDYYLMNVDGSQVLVSLDEVNGSDMGPDASSWYVH